MAGPKTMDKLLVDELKDIYSAENQILKALPKLAKAASSQQLREAFQTHLEQTRGQVARLDQIATMLGEKSLKGKKCVAMEGLVKEGSELIEEGGDPQVLDAALIAAAQKVEHYEMASYGTVRTWAKLLGQTEVSSLLQETLNEEGETDKLLTRLSTRLNVKAKLEGGDEASKGGSKSGASKRGGSKSGASRGSSETGGSGS